MEKDVYTTGEVARMCNVTIRTVIKWFETGELKGYKIPGSRDRRIPKENLVVFARKHGIPLREGGGPRKRRVLVADDDEALAKSLVEELEEMGLFEVRTARSGYEAGMITMDFKPDLLLLDYNLGDIDGAEVTRLVRANPAVNRTRILVMSGFLKGTRVNEVLAAGADDFLRKPFTFGEVRERVFKLLGLV
jgi:excisionase family DNA binding protein